MLTGERPFTGRSPAELVAQRLNEPVPSPDAPLSANPDELARLVGWMTEREPEGRPASYGILLDEVERVLAVERGVATPTPKRSIDDIRADGGEHGPVVAVLPFEDLSAEGDQEYFCDGVADDVITTLASVDRLRVVSRASSFQFKARRGDPRSIGRALNVAAVLEGSLQREGDRLRINVKLIDVASEETMWAERFEGKLGEIFAFQDEIAGRVADRLSVELAPDHTASGPAHRTEDLGAYELSLKGRFYWNKRTEGGMQRSVDYFRRAITRDPSFAKAHAGVADALALLTIYGAVAPTTAMPEAKEAAAEALRLDADLAEAHTSLGSISALYDWAWDDAEAHFRAAVRLDDGYALAHHWYALTCLIPQHRFDEALEQIHRAQSLEPFSPTISASPGLYGYFAGEYDAAASALRATVDRTADFAFAHLFLGLTYSEMGEHEDALDALGDALALSAGSPEVVAAIGYAEAMAGNEAGAAKALGNLDELSATRHIPPSLVARVLVGMGDVEGGLDHLEKAVQAKSADLAWLTVRPIFAPIRVEPRFVDIVEKLGLAG